MSHSGNTTVPEYPQWKYAVSPLQTSVSLGPFSNEIPN